MAGYDVGNHLEETLSDPTSSAADELSVYDSVPLSPSQAGRSITGPRAGSSATSIGRAPSMQVTMALLATLLVTSLVVLVAGLAMAREQDASQFINLTLITLGGCLVVWHLRSLLTGSGRRTAMISSWPWVGLAVVAAFGLALGFSLFDLLTGARSASRIALVVAGVVGMIAGLIGFMRDSDLRERGAHRPRPQPVAEPEPEPEPVIVFDPTGEDELRPRGSWPQPKRGSLADASLWEEPADQDEPPQRARRGA